MYSTNGRVKGSKAVAAKNKKKEVTVTCENCGAEVKMDSKQFGEDPICPKCGERMMNDEESD